MEENTAIVLQTKPVIAHELQKVGANVTKRLNDLKVDKLVATEDSVKSLKQLSADLNAELKQYEAQRKMIKEGVMAPYNDFEAIYKTEISTKYNDAINVLREKISTVENKIKKEKSDRLREYYESVKGSIDFLSFERLGLDVNLSTTEKKYKEQIHAIIDKVLGDLELIEVQEHKTEVLVEYKDTLDVSASILAVRKRKEKEKAEEEKANAAMQRVINNTPVPAPQEPQPQPQPQQPAPDPDPIIPQPQPQEEIKKARLEISGTMPQLKALIEYIKANQMTYKNI